MWPFRYKIDPELVEIKLREYCVNIAMAHAQPAPRNVVDTLKGAQHIHDWMRGHGLPIEHGPTDEDGDLIQFGLGDRQ